MYLRMHCPHLNTGHTRFRAQSVCKSEAHQASLKRTLQWGWIPSIWLERISQIVCSETSGNSGHYHRTYYSNRRISGKVAAEFPLGVDGVNTSLRQVTKWNSSESPWLFKLWQQLLGLVNARKCCWLREYAVVAMTVIVVQGITSHDISHALPSTCPSLLEPKSVMEFPISTWTKSDSIVFCGARLDSYRCNSKVFTMRKTSLLKSVVGPGMRVYTASNLKRGALLRRQARGRGFEGLVSSIGGVLLATNASSIVLQSSPLAVVTGSLTSPLASIVNAGSHVDVNVLRASFTSSLNLISLC